MLSDSQITTLTLVSDTLVPSVERARDPDGFFRRKASDIGTHLIIAEVIRLSPPEGAAQFAAVLDLLASPGLGATWGGPEKGFAELSAPEREQVMLAWMHSPVPDLRACYVALAGLVFPFYYAYSDDRGPNPNWGAIGYEGPITAAPAPSNAIRPLVFERDTELSCDTLIIGSGAGGGVVAGELAAAGHDVIVVEKGPYVAEDGFTQRETEMTLRLYEQGGGLRTKNAGIAVLAGSCVGGGTTINWSGALRTPEYVLEEWAKDHGNAHFLGAEFRRSVEAVERATNVNSSETHIDRKGQILQEGARKLGYHVNVYPRNVKGCDPKVCGYCCFGCRLGAKQGTMKTYLKTAVDAGARILADTEVTRIVRSGSTATGIEAVYRSPGGAAFAVAIRARRIVVSGGSIHTPAILRRSGFTHPQIGRNLHIHPGSGIAGRYAEPVRPWSGSMMPVSCDEFTRLDGNYGFKLVNAPLHVAWLTAVDFRSGEDHKERMLEAGRIASIGTFVRERDTGRVTVDVNGQPVVDYWPSEYDMKHVIRGLQESARMHFEAGAELLYLPRYRRFEPREGKRKLEEALAEFEAAGLEPNLHGVMTAHQMGTCRMGGDAERHPVTPEGRTREATNVFVADASTFPTCSGANPMPSVQHIAHYVSQGIKAAS
jgi:choline dehydrogenase-like flavoprotein